MYNVHTHTMFCDGTAAPEQYIKAALEKGFKVLGFSAHAPVGFDNEWSLKQEDTDDYFSNILHLKEEYKNDITILNGLEIDFIPGITQSFSSFRQKHKLDYVIGSIHFVKVPMSSNMWFIDGPKENFVEGLKMFFDNNIKKAVTLFYEQTNDMIRIEKPDIIGHLDKIKLHNTHYFDISEPWYRDAIEKTLEVISEHKSVVEVNTRGVYTGKCRTLFPDTFILEMCKEKKIPIMLNADAHNPKDLDAYFVETIDILKNIGFKELTVLTSHGKKCVPIDKYL